MNSLERMAADTDGPLEFLLKEQRESFVKLRTSGWMLYEMNDDKTVVMRRDDDAGVHYQIIKPDGTVAERPVHLNTAADRVRNALVYVRRQLNEVWRPHTTYAKVHRGWALEQLDVAIESTAMTDFILVRLFEAATSDGYKSSGTGMLFHDRVEAMAWAKAKNGNYATEPLIHDALHDGRGLYYLLKVRDPVKLADTHKAAEEVRRVALSKLSPEEKVALGLA